MKEDYTLSVRMAQLITERNFMFTSLKRNNELFEKLAKEQEELALELLKGQQELIKDVKSLLWWQRVFFIVVPLWLASNTFLVYWLR